MIHGNPWENHRDDRCSLPAVLNKETYHLLQEEKLRLLKREAVVINTSLGSAVNVRAPFRCLQGKAIAGAGFDVLEEEPAVPTNPLLKADHAAVTPHGLPVTDEGRQKLIAAAVKECLTALGGEMPNNAVDKHALAKWQQRFGSADKNEQEDEQQ